MFESMGGKQARYLFFLRQYVPIAPMRVARLPNTISYMVQPVRIFEMRQPRKSPGTEAFIKHGRMQSASENLI